MKVEIPGPGLARPGGPLNTELSVVFPRRLGHVGVVADKTAEASLPQAWITAKNNHYNDHDHYEHRVILHQDDGFVERQWLPHV